MVDSNEEKLIFDKTVYIFQISLPFCKLPVEKSNVVVNVTGLRVYNGIFLLEGFAER